ncbi:MAG: hypothetical protein QM775_11125 [Pirellulales bacterium]
MRRPTASAVFFSAPVTEGGWALVALDGQGRLVQGYEHQHGFGIQHNAVAADSQYLYCTQDGFAWGGRPDFNNPNWSTVWKVTVVRYDIKSGKLVEWPGKQRAMGVDAMTVGPKSDLKSFNLGGLAVLDGKLYVGSRDKRAIFVLDATTGRTIEKLPLEGVRHLAAGKEVLAATDRGIVRIRDGKLMVEHADVAGLAVAANGEFFVSDGATHQVRHTRPTVAKFR